MWLRVGMHVDWRWKRQFSCSSHRWEALGWSCHFNCCGMYSSLNNQQSIMVMLFPETCSSSYSFQVLLCHYKLLGALIYVFLTSFWAFPSTSLSVNELCLLVCFDGERSMCRMLVSFCMFMSGVFLASRPCKPQVIYCLCWDLAPSTCS